MESTEVLKEREYFKVQCMFSRTDRWIGQSTEYENFEQASRAGSIFLNQEDIEDYRVVKVEKRETVIHP